MDFPSHKRLQESHKSSKCGTQNALKNDEEMLFFPVFQLYVEKQKGESLGVVIVESGWGSILPTVILASMLNSGPAARSGKLSVGDQIMSINDTSLVGLPLATCQGIIKVRSVSNTYNFYIFTADLVFTQTRACM